MVQEQPEAWAGSFAGVDCWRPVPRVVWRCIVDADPEGDDETSSATPWLDVDPLQAWTKAVGILTGPVGAFTETDPSPSFYPL